MGSESTGSNNYTVLDLQYRLNTSPCTGTSGVVSGVIGAGVSTVEHVCQPQNGTGWPTRAGEVTERVSAVVLFSCPFSPRVLAGQRLTDVPDDIHQVHLFVFCCLASD